MNIKSVVTLLFVFSIVFSANRVLAQAYRGAIKGQTNIFNAFNRVIFSNGGNAETFILKAAPPNLSAASLSSSNTVFGIMTAQQNGPRIIQFSLKLEF